jgi:hypothetical protein
MFLFKNFDYYFPNLIVIRLMNEFSKKIKTKVEVKSIIKKYYSLY